MYLNLVMGLGFLTDFLLLLATNRLCGYPPDSFRNMAAAAVGGVYAGACLVPDFPVAGNSVWQIAAFLLVTVLAFGLNRTTVRRSAVYLLLKLAMAGVAEIMDHTLLLALGALLLLCFLADHIAVAQLIPVELSYRNKTIRIMALRDTGNMLTDPISGSQVLVVEPETAQRLTGLSLMELSNPIDTLTSTPGLRLIPYHSVGKSCGMMLGMKLHDVKIGSWQGSTVVAFAPEELCKDNRYQALMGGDMV